MSTREIFSSSSLQVMHILGLFFLISIGYSKLALCSLMLTTQLFLFSLEP
jgi:hypothetical protein